MRHVCHTRAICPHARRKPHNRWPRTGCKHAHYRPENSHDTEHMTKSFLPTLLPAAEYTFGYPFDYKCLPLFSFILRIFVFVIHNQTHIP